MNVGIIGASGYTGEALVKLLDRHPHVSLKAVTSRKLEGVPVSEAIPALRGRLDAMPFVNSSPDELAARADIEVYFLALPHGVATEFAKPLVAAGKRVIDLSADYRLGSEALYEEYYGTPHPAPELLADAPYVIPELAAAGWQGAKLIACPGCYPTTVQVPLVPLLRAGVIKPQGIVINASSGVSGAGKKAAELYSFSERNENAVAYGIPKHRHLAEIEEQFSKAAGVDTVINFIPHLAPITRGIIATTVVPAAEGKTLDDLYAAWQEAYAGKPFVSVLKSGVNAEALRVAHTNRCDISAVYDARTNNFIITSALDNLIKGAGGQGVQIMNLIYGYPEEAGLV